jgi:hypothetical protein
MFDFKLDHDFHPVSMSLFTLSGNEDSCFLWTHYHTQYVFLYHTNCVVIRKSLLTSQHDYCLFNIYILSWAVFQLYSRDQVYNSKTTSSKCLVSKIVRIGCGYPVAWQNGLTLISWCDLLSIGQSQRHIIACINCKWFA